MVNRRSDGNPSNVLDASLSYTSEKGRKMKRKPSFQIWVFILGFSLPKSNRRHERKQSRGNKCNDLIVIYFEILLMVALGGALDFSLTCVGPKSKSSGFFFHSFVRSFVRLFNI